ncbi:MAG: prepilin-type N-terminal cleavage/methylation domain-containing protein [Deltaproteobacteria bacterium]|nr:prepilin-type N-terminal cleavage/methylation domain-containing protein [Deltaproteobacteria bacterium]
MKSAANALAVHFQNPMAHNPFHSGFKTGKTGFTVLELLFVMGIVGIVAAISIPMYFSFIQKARETAVIAFLSRVRKAEEMHKLADPSGLYSGDFQELAATGGIPPAPGNSTRDEHDYRFTISSGTSAGQPYWRVNAAPLDGGASSRWFYVDDEGVIRAETGGAASSASPPIAT